MAKKGLGRINEVNERKKKKKEMMEGKSEGKD